MTDRINQEVASQSKVQKIPSYLIRLKATPSNSKVGKVFIVFALEEHIKKKKA